MTTKKKSATTKAKQQESINKVSYEDFGYAPDAKVEMSAELYTRITQTLFTLLEEETRIYFSPEEAFEGNKEEFKQQMPVKLMTAKGYAFNYLLDLLEDIHKSNVDKGIAVHVSELQKPDVELVRE